MAVPLASPENADLRLRVLGHVSATRAGQPVDLGGPRQRAVLARLVLGRGGLVSTEQLIEALWGDEPPPTATASLQTYISHLRRRLQPDRRGRDRGGLISSASGGYALHLPIESVDAWQFEALLRTARELTDTNPTDAVGMLQDALALWRGPAYTGHSDQPWAEAEVARLHELRALAGEQLLAARLQGGESALLVPELELLVDQEPLREERWRLLVLALYRSGRQADALSALRRARAVLADELGVDPGPALRALEAGVLAQSPNLDAVVPLSRSAVPDPRSGPTEPAGAASGPDGGADSAGRTDVGAGRAATALRPTRPRLRDELVERDRELGELTACLADALDEQGRLALVSGPAGIGKSRLLAEARHLINEAAVGEAGALLLSARCSELEREFGFGAVRQLFEPLLTDPTRRAELLRGSAVSAGPVFDLEAGPNAPGLEESSFATLHGLYWMTVNLAAERPVVLLVDDLQWCDSGSLRFLTYLVRRLEGLRVLVLATFRTGEEPADAALLEELRLDVATVPVRLGPLSLAGLRRIIAARLGAEPEAAFTSACFDTTSGNPLLLRQLLRALDSEGVRPDGSHADTARALGSRAISSMVLLRLRRLPPAATAVARALAVLGDEAPLPIVAALAGLDEAVAAGATAGLARAEVLRAEAPLAFVHALVRSAVLGDLAPGERELLHDRAARLLDRSGAPAEQVAAQLLLAPPRADGWAVEKLRAAASAALRRGAPDGATSYLNRALAEPPAPPQRTEVLLELGRAEVSADGPSALGHLQEAYDELTDPQKRAAVALALVRTLVFAGERGAAAAFAREARDELPESLVDERQGLLALGRISVHMHGLDAAEWGLVAAGNPEPELVGDGPGARMLAAQLAWERMCIVSPRQAVIELAEQALSDGSLYAVDNGLLWVVATMVQDLADVDVMPLWDHSLALAHQRGSLFSVLSVSLWRGYSLRRRGDLREAEESLRVAVEQLEMWKAPVTGAAYAEAELVRVLIDQDRLTDARSVLATAGGVPLSDGQRLLLEAEARILLAEERWAAAVPLLERAGTMLPHMRNPAWRSGPALLAAAYAGMNRAADALSILEEQIDAARRWGAPSILAPLLRQAGVIRFGQDSADGQDTAVGGAAAVGHGTSAGLAQLYEAEQLLAGTEFRLEHGETLHAIGRALLESAPTDRARAIGLLLRALEIAESCSATRLRRQATEALADAGVVVPESRRVGLAALTSTQRRIAVLAADGVPVRDVAESLFLTPRGVEQHLAAVRRRLGIDEAADLAEALAAASADAAADVDRPLDRRPSSPSVS